MRRWIACVTGAIRTALIPAALAGCVVLAGCGSPASFSAPLSEPDETPFDDRVLGTWGTIYGKSGEEGASVLLVVARRGDALRAAYMVSILDPWEFGGNSGWYEWEVHPSEIDGTLYFNARMRLMAAADSGMSGELFRAFAVDPSYLERVPVYQIARVEMLSDDRMALAGLRQTEISGRGLPRIEMPCGEGCPDEYFFEVTSEQLREIVRTGDHESLFEPALILGRLEGTIPAQPGN